MADTPLSSIFGPKTSAPIGAAPSAKAYSGPDALQISGASPSPGNPTGSTDTTNDPLFGDPLKPLMERAMAIEHGTPLDRPGQVGTGTRPVIYRANLKKGTSK